jgi:hypothetical protein
MESILVKYSSACPRDCTEMESSIDMKSKHSLVIHLAVLISHFEAKEVKKCH